MHLNTVNYLQSIYSPFLTFFLLFSFLFFGMCLYVCVNAESLFEECLAHSGSCAVNLFYMRLLLWRSSTVLQMFRKWNLQIIDH